MHKANKFWPILCEAHEVWPLTPETRPKNAKRQYFSCTFDIDYFTVNNYNEEIWLTTFKVWFSINLFFIWYIKDLV
jgi:hypothetical protein